MRSGNSKIIILSDNLTFAFLDWGTKEHISYQCWFLMANYIYMYYISSHMINVQMLRHASMTLYDCSRLVHCLRYMRLIDTYMYSAIYVHVE